MFISCNGQEKKEHKTFYEDGTVEKQGQFDENGKRFGEYKEYHTNGKLESIGHYKNGEEINEWKFYNEQDKLTETLDY
ncbi:MAG: hypothetical protein ACK5IC_10965 [Moheibacter sp.]